MKNLTIILGLILYFSAPANLFASATIYVPKQIILKTNNPIPYQTLLKSIISSQNTQALDPILKKYRIKKIKSFSGAPGIRKSTNQHQSRVQKEASKIFRNVYKFEFTDDLNILEIIEEFQKENYIIWAQPNYIYKATHAPDDTYYSSQQWNLPLIKADQSWDITEGDDEVIVAVIDTGVDWQHPDLENNIWENKDETENGLDDDGNGYVDDIRGWDFVDVVDYGYQGEDYEDTDNNPMDTNGHGTHVSGIVAAEINNNSGIAGVAPKCKIMAIRAGFSSGSGVGSFRTDAIAYAIQYAVSNNASVINLSLGSQIATETDPLIDAAIQNALTAGNTPVITAAGNDADNLNLINYIPAKINGVIAISAIAPDKSLASYSNFGDVVDICAPGGTGSGGSGEDIYSTFPGNRYRYLSGTSMATPQVSGLAALLLTLKPTLSTENIYQVLTATAEDLGTLGKDSDFGYGLINCYDAIKSLDTNPPNATHNKAPTADIGNYIIITANITDELNSTTIPTANFHYRFYKNSSPSGNWLESGMQRDENVFSIVVPPVNEASDIHYYFEIDDIKPTHSITLPATNPETNSYVLSIRDISAPTIKFPALDLDYVSTTKIVSVQITDNISVDSNSILLTVTTLSGKTEYNLSSSALTFQNSELQIDLSKINIESEDQVVLMVSVFDNKGNKATNQITLYSTQSFKLFGPEGENSNILNAPNPFNPGIEDTKICFNLSKEADVTIYVYSLNLSLVKKWEQSFLAGYHDEITWDGRDEDGDIVPNGVYVLIVKAVSDGKTIIKRNKIAVLR